MNYMNTRGTYGDGARYGRAAVGPIVHTGWSWQDVFTPGYSAVEAIAKLDHTANVAAIDAQVDKLNREWHPTGQYEPADMEKMIARVTSTVAKAISIVRNAPLTTVDAETVNRQWLSKLAEGVAKSVKYVNASIVARGKGTLVDAPDFKRWVLFTMNDASSAFNHADILNSHRSWIKEAIVQFMPFIVQMAEGLMLIGGAIKDKATTIAQDYLKPVLYVGLGIVGIVVLSSVMRR